MIVSLRSPIPSRSPKAPAYGESGSMHAPLSAPVMRKLLASGSASGNVATGSVATPSSRSCTVDVVVSAAELSTAPVVVGADPSSGDETGTDVVAAEVVGPNDGGAAGSAAAPAAASAAGSCRSTMLR